MRSWTAIWLLWLAASLPWLGTGDCLHARRVKRIVGGTEAPPPPVDDPLVFVRRDDREARVYGTRDKQSGYYMFRGIRYAEPPVGNRRFQVSLGRSNLVNSLM